MPPKKMRQPEGKVRARLGAEISMQSILTFPENISRQGLSVCHSTASLQIPAFLLLKIGQLEFCHGG